MDEQRCLTRQIATLGLRVSHLRELDHSELSANRLVFDLHTVEVCQNLSESASGFCARGRPGCVYRAQ